MSKAQRIGVILTYPETVKDEYDLPLVTFMDITDEDEPCDVRKGYKRPVKGELLFYGDEIEYTQEKIDDIVEFVEDKLRMCMAPGSKLSYGDTLYFLVGANHEY